MAPLHGETIIQWNCRGIRPNYEEMQLIIQNHSPIVVALQETKINDNNNVKFKNFTKYSKNLQADVAHGGVMVLVANTTPHSHLPVVTDLQAVAVRISLHRPVSLCSLYLPPNIPIILRDLEDLISQLPPPVLVMGDFNAHSTVWGCDQLNNRGKIIEDFLNHSNLCLLNEKTPTYVYPATGKYSAIDLTICDPNLMLDLSWSVHDDLCGSDHFPLIIRSTIPVAGPTIQRWKLHKADWSTYQDLCTEHLIADKFLGIQEPFSEFTKTLVDIAGKTIPKTKANPKHPSKPWFNDNCKTAIAERKQALKNFDRQPTARNLDAFRICRAKARRTIRQEKKESWRNYVSGLNSRITVKKAWDMVRKINGKSSAMAVKHLSLNNNLITDVKDICNTLALTISQNSSDNHYSVGFQRHKLKIESTALSFKSRNQEYYNIPFKFSELTDALHQTNDSSPGPDEIPYPFIKNLPPDSLHLLLKLYNKIWEGGVFPPLWQQAIVVPIPKPEKDHSDPNNYRPIALTSCLCKLFERMINSRLVFYLESNNLLAETQSGFRKQRCTTDHLIRLESWIREGIVNREHVVAIFFDLEKAYDTTWRHGILVDLHNAGLRGNLPVFISKFLENRSFRVRVGNTFSNVHTQENGVPQGSVLSVTLFGLKINSIVKCLNNGVDNSLFVDDFNVCCRSKNMRTIERKLQLCLNNLQTWTDENGFKFSETKTVCVHFCNQRRQHAHPDLTLHNQAIPVVNDTKFLGVIFDSKLSFIPHMRALRTKCTKAMNLLKVVAGKGWGSDSKTLLKLYRALIRSKLDYGSIIYGSARKSYVQMLDPIQNQALRICLGAFRTSPVVSLEVEADEPPLAIRRQKLSIQYACKLKSNPSHPATQCTYGLLHKHLFDAKPNVIPSFGIRIDRLVPDIGLDMNIITESQLPSDPPWMLARPEVDLCLHNVKKESISAEYHKLQFNEYCSNKSRSVFLYTDGSKDDVGVAAAVCSGNTTSTARLPNHASIFTAEAHAIILALDLIESMTNDSFVIFSDSLSCLQAIASFKHSHPLILKILERYNLLYQHNKSVLLCWIPSHMGIKGNEAADAAAKAALQEIIDDAIKIPYSDIKHKTSAYFKQLFQTHWNNVPFNKLQSIKDHIGTTVLKNITSRRDEVVLHRARIGHTHLTHCYLLNKENAPECTHCQCLLTVEHILLQCQFFNDIRERHYKADTLKQLFSDILPVNIINYLKEINYYEKF